jgi:hypothetical protein
MKTKEFIKMLQEADPSGEAHIRMEGGIPRFAELKPGYWDGPYSYLDEDGNWVYSSEGDKVDIHCFDRYDYVSEMFTTYSIPTWGEVRSKFKFRLGYSDNSEREENSLTDAKEAFEHSTEMYQGFKVEEEELALSRSEKGWTWFQNKLVDDPTIRPNIHHYYTWIVLDETGKDQGSNLHNVQPVYKSGLFERHDNGVKEGYYQWIKK